MGTDALDPARSHQPGKAIASIALNALYIAGGRGLTNAVRFVYSIVLARKLGPELYGLYNYGMSWYLAFLPMAGIGLSFLLSREVGRNRANGPRVVAQTLLVRVIVNVAVFAVSIIAGLLLETNPQARLLLVIFSFALVGRSLSTWSEQVFTAFETSKYYLLQQALFRPLEVICGMLALYAGGGVVAVTAIHAIVWWLESVCGVYWVCRRMVRVQWDGVGLGLGSVFLHGFHLGIGLLLVNWLQQGPVVLFRHVGADQGSLGQLALAMQVFMVLYFFPIAAGTAALPVLSRSAERQDGMDLRFARTMLKAGTVLETAAGLIGMAVGPWLVKTIFGIRYETAGHVAVLVVWLLIPWTCGDTLYRLQLARGKFILSSACAAVGAAVFTLTMSWLVSLFNASGAVLAAGLGMAAWAALSILTFRQKAELDLGRTVYRPLALAFASVTVTLALNYVSVWLALPAGLLALFGGVFLAGVTTREERQTLWSVIRPHSRTIRTEKAAE